MKRLRQALAKIAEALGLNKTLLARARRRYSANHKRAVANHHKAKVAARKADSLRAEGHLVAAAQEDKVAARCHHRAYKSHLRAQWWIGRVKLLCQRIEGLEQTQEELQAQLKKLEREHGVTITGNKVTGGTPRQRLQAAMLASAAACASGKRPNFYSQAGAWDIDHCITGERSGERSDCSSWFTSVYKSCGLPDPNGADYSGGYTGTLGAHGRPISRSELDSGDAILFGTAPFHHVEMKLGRGGTATIGHGSAPVDRGVVDLLPGPKAYRSFV